MSEDKSKLSELVVEKRRTSKVPTPLEELEELEQLELMEMAKEAKRLRLQELIEKYRRRVDELKSQGKAFKMDLPPQFVVELAKMPEEQRMQVLQVMQMLKAIENAPPQLAQVGALAPLIMMIYGNKQMQQNNPQGSSMKDLAEALKIMVEVANASRQQGNPDANTLIGSILSKLTESTISLYNMLAEERLKRLEERLSYNPLDATKQILAIAQEMKKLVGESSSPQTLAKLKELELKANVMMQKMQLDQQKWQFQQQMEREKWLRQQELEKEKWKSINEIFRGPVGSAVGRVLNDLGRATASRINPQANRGSQPRIVQTTCPRCNKPFYVDETLDRTVCPHCGTLLQKVIESGESAGQMGGGGGQQTQQPSQ